MSVDRGRLKATWKLAETCLDHLPQARQPSSTLGTLAGLAPSRLAPCTTCGARGRVSNGKPCVGCAPRTNPDRPSAVPVPRHGCTPCPSCEGDGWRRRRKADPQIDAYAGVEVQAQDKADDISVGAMRRALADDRERPEKASAALARATRVIDMHERPDSSRFRWEEEWDRMCIHGSYAELMVALELLRMTDERSYSIIWHVVCCHEDIRLSPSRQAFLNESMVALTGYMPERIRVPWWLRESKKVHDARKTSLWRGRSPAHARERRDRDAEVNRLADEEGWTTARLSREFGLNRSQIKRIRATARERSQGNDSDAG